MILLISPAKTLDLSPIKLKKHSQPIFLEASKYLANILKKASVKDLTKLMAVSEKIAALNVHRYQSFTTPFTLANAKQAGFAFKGDVYRGLDIESFDARDLNFAQKHLRILSGLYGILKPLDLIQAYRLEMGTRLKIDNNKNLYEFWGDKITDLINQDLENQKSKAVINLASQEYFRAVITSKLNGKLYHIHFKENRNGQYKIISFSAKKARGMMCHYIVKNRIKSPAHLMGFDYDGYLFNEELSDKQSFVFTR